MDSASNSQNPQQGNPPVGQQPVEPVGAQPVSQQPSLSPSGGDSQTPSQSTIPPVVSQGPNVQNGAPTPPAEGPKITLQDLYGPSGLAQDSSQDQLPQPLVSTTAPQPVQPQIATDNAQQQPVESVPPVQVLNQTTQPFTDASVQQVQSEQSKPSDPVQTPPTSEYSSQSVPSVESVSQQPVVQPAVDMQPAQNPPEASVSQDMPLRKPSKDVSQKEEPLQSSSDNPPPEETKKPLVNKFLLLRILFGGVAVVIFMIVILFVVQFFSHFSSPSTSSGKVTLTYWGLWEDPNTMQSIISQFESSHPDITIQYVKEDPKDYSERLLTRVQNGTGPDIFTYHSSWLPMVQTALVPLPTSVVSKTQLENDFYPVVKNDLVENGALYGVPLGVDTLALFVNNTMLQTAKVQVPTTWDNFITVARALTVKDANGKITTAGAALGTFDNITHAPDILSTLFMQNGVDITTMKPSSNAADALSFYTSFASGDSSVWDSTLDPSQLAFARGKLAMYFGYSWDIFLIKASNPTLDFSVHPIPHLPGRNTTAASYWVEGVSSKSTHQKEAFLFMQYIAQKNTLATLYGEEAKTRMFGEPYPQVGLGNTLKDNALVYPFVEQASDAKSSFFAGETQDTGLNGQMNAYLGNAVRGALGNTSPQTAIDTLTQGVEQIEKQYAGG